MAFEKTESLISRFYDVALGEMCILWGSAYTVKEVSLYWGGREYLLGTGGKLSKEENIIWVKLLVALGVTFLCHKSYIGFLKLLIRLLLSPVNVCQFVVDRQASNS